MCFVPVDFGTSYSTRGQVNKRFAFHFAPPALPVQPPQPLQLVDTTTDGNDLDIADLTDDLEMHAVTL